MDDELFLLLCLLNIKGLGQTQARQLFQDGGITQFLSQNPLSTEAKRLAEQELCLARKLNVLLLSLSSPAYPKPFKELSDPPLLLYVAGDITRLERCIGVIGTRQATHYGKEMAERFGEQLAEQGWAVISGLARGIDTSAHRGALKRGVTAAILGSGLANLYPKENQDLAHKIAQEGVLISEFALRTPPHPYHFPKRNRLVSCLSQALVLIEAPLKSGAMGTMELGQKQGRQLFALPGRADIETFKGNHALIKLGRAQLVETPDEVSEAMGYSGVQRVVATPVCSKEEAQLLAFFPAEEVSFDRLALDTSMNPSALNAALMRLLLKGLIKEYPNKQYRKR